MASDIVERAREAIKNGALNHELLGAMADEIVRLRVHVDMRRKIAAYVAFVLAGDDNADVQLAADEAKAELERLRSERRALADSVRMRCVYELGRHCDCARDVLALSVDALLDEPAESAQPTTDGAHEAKEKS